jgi:hypothetical protein
MRVCVLLAGLLVSASAWALDGNTWIRTYVGGFGHSVYETPDGGAIMAGTFGPQTAACCDPWLIKLDAGGAVEWQMIYDAPGLAGANNIVPTQDGGYVMAGDGVEFLVVKVAANGQVQWARNYGDGGFTHLRVLEADDGNILVTGASRLGDNSQNGRAVLLDPNGNVRWQRVFGSFVFPDFFAQATQAYNGNFIVAGSSIGDYWVMELDADTGDPVWQKIYGGPGEDTGLVITKAMKRRYVMVGASETFTSGGLRNWWVVILNQSGKVWKQFSIGGIDAEDPHSVIGTSDGGFMVAGGTGSFGAGFSDIWLVKFDSRAEVEWQKSYGLSTRTDSAWQILETESGYAVIADSFFFPIEYEIWLMTLDKNGDIAGDECGLVGDTDAVPFTTIGASGEPRTVDFGATAKPSDLRVVATSLELPIETCEP